MNITPTHTAQALNTPLPHLSKPDVAAQLKQGEIAQGPAATRAESPLKAIKASQEAEAARAQKPENQEEAPNQPQAIDKEALRSAVERIQEFMGSINKDIKFLVDEKETNGELMVKILDHQTQEVIRQIPSEEALHIAKTLDKLKGLLLYNKA